MRRKALSAVARALGAPAERPWETRTATDAYVSERLRLRDPASESVAKAVQGAGLPPIGVSPTRGRLLELFGRLLGATRILGPDPWGEAGGVEAVGTLYEKLGREPRLEVTALRTVGERGHDGFALAVVTEPGKDG